MAYRKCLVKLDRTVYRVHEVMFTMYTKIQQCTLKYNNVKYNVYWFIVAYIQ